MITYHGFDLLEDEPNGRDPRDNSLELDIRSLDPQTGLRFSESSWPASPTVFPFSWFCQSRAEVAAFLAFVDARVGRLVPVWIPSREMALTPSVDPGFVDTLRINDIGYTDFAFPAGGARRHIWIWSPKLFSAKRYRKIVFAEKNMDGTETITLDSPLYVNATTDWLYGFLRLCRLEEDVPVIEWHSPRVAEVTLMLRELPQEAPT
jgi:hypothetical protein